MSKRPRNVHLPLKNITSSFNAGNVFRSSCFVTGMDSPMSNLAFDLSELSTGRNTPRRKLSLSSVSTPDAVDGRPDLDSGCGLWFTSPTGHSTASKLEYNKADDTITLDSDKTVDENSSGKLYLDDVCSQDSGLGLEQDRRGSLSSFDDAVSTSSASSSSSLNNLERMLSLDDVWSSLDSPSFKTPKGKPPKRSRSLVDDDKHFSEDACSPIKYSPIKSSSVPQPSLAEALFYSKTPEAKSKPADGDKFETDDGFQELFKLNDTINEADDQLSSLISATLLHHPCEDHVDETGLEEMSKTSKKTAGAMTETPLSRQAATRCALQRSQSLDIRVRPSSKRCEPPFDGTTPIQCKRWRGDEGILQDKSNSNIGDTGNRTVNSRRLHRCHSETEAVIKLAISRMFAEPDLIGDCSKPYSLPTVNGKHQDLKSISSETLSRLIAKEFSDVIELFHIIDCRYPYEYEGGHIQTAVNIYTKERVIEQYMKSPLSVKDPNKRIILVFHCEFSSERGPGLFRFLRRQDRETNKERYPFLHYPEIYLLEGGYKNFFEKYSNLCEPREYKTMFDKNHSEDLRKFRAKCKSWSEEKTQPRTGVRNLKF